MKIFFTCKQICIRYPDPPVRSLTIPKTVNQNRLWLKVKNNPLDKILFMFVLLIIVTIFYIIMISILSFPAYKELSRQHFCSNHGILDRRFTPPTYNYSSCGEYFNSIGLWIQNLPAAIDSENSERFDARHQQRSSRYWKIVNGNSKIWQYFGRLPALIPAANR